MKKKKDCKITRTKYKNIEIITIGENGKIPKKMETQIQNDINNSDQIYQFMSVKMKSVKGMIDDLLERGMKVVSVRRYPTNIPERTSITLIAVKLPTSVGDMYT